MTEDQNTRAPVELLPLSPWARSLHWLGDRDAAGGSQHAKDKTGCVLYFGTEAECRKFMEWYTGLASDTSAPVAANDGPTYVPVGDGDICIDCDGRGIYPSKARCVSCGGTGAVLSGDGNTRAPVVSSQAGEKVFRHHANETLEESEYLLRQSISAPGGMGDLADEPLAKWHREWHWKDCERESIDHSIYPRDLRMLKAFIEHCNLRTAAQSAEVRERTIEECASMVEKVYCYAPPEVSSGTIAKSIVLAIRALAQAGGKR